MLACVIEKETRIVIFIDIWAHIGHRNTNYIYGEYIQNIFRKISLRKKLVTILKNTSP